MNAKSLIQDQIKILEDTRKRFDERQTTAKLDKLLANSAEAQKDQIEARIERLERQKIQVIAKVDAAIAREREALKLVQTQMPDIDLKPGKGGTRPTKRTAAATKKTTIKKTTTKGSK